jgi:putative membrane protein
MKAETFFSKADNERIFAAIREVESKTAGEIAVMVVDRSDTYPEARIMIGILFGGLLSLIVSDLLFDDSLWVFAPVTALLTVLLGWFSQFTPEFLRFFVPASRLESKVEERAVRAFYEKGLYKTRDDTGVLFFISLFEHKVWVLADAGIYRKMTQVDLQRYAGDIARSIKDGTASEALCREIRSVGKVLAEHFPIKPDDVNELSDQVIIG